MPRKPKTGGMQKTKREWQQVEHPTPLTLGYWKLSLGIAAQGGSLWE